MRTPSSEREIHSHTCYKRRAGWSSGRSLKFQPCWNASTICLYAVSVLEHSTIPTSVVGGARTQALTGKDVESSVVLAGAQESVSAITFSLPAIHLISNGWSSIFSRSLMILLLSIWFKLLAKIPMRGLWSVTTSKRSIPLRKKLHFWTAQTIAVSSNSRAE